MGQLTVKHLYELVKAEMLKGNGKKYIVTADDVEGNSYHGVWFGFISEPNSIKETIECSNGISDTETENENEFVILG